MPSLCGGSSKQQCLPRSCGPCVLTPVSCVRRFCWTTASMSCRLGCCMYWECRARYGGGHQIVELRQPLAGRQAETACAATLFPWRPYPPLPSLFTDTSGWGSQARRTPRQSTPPWPRPWLPSQRWATQTRRARAPVHASHGLRAHTGAALGACHVDGEKTLGPSFWQATEGAAWHLTDRKRLCEKLACTARVGGRRRTRLAQHLRLEAV